MRVSRRRVPLPAYQRHPFAGPRFIIYPDSRVAVIAAAGCGQAYAARAGARSGARALQMSVGDAANYEAANGPLTKIGVFRDPIDRFLAAHDRFAVRGEPDHFMWFAAVEGCSAARFAELAALELGKSDPALQHPSLRRQVDEFAAAQVDLLVDVHHLPRVLSGLDVALPRGPVVRRLRRRSVPPLVADLYAADLERGQHLPKM